MIPTTQDLTKMFEQINLDCQKTNESIVPLTDVDYYADQIANIYDVDHATAKAAALKMAQSYVHTFLDFCRYEKVYIISIVEHYLENIENGTYDESPSGLSPEDCVKSITLEDIYKDYKMLKEA